MNKEFEKNFCCSPNELSAERLELEEIVKELNTLWGDHFGRFDLVKWETHAYPGAASDPQQVINTQIGNDCDIFIGILWKKLGTPTTRAESGTVEEFERAYERFLKGEDVKIMFYFNTSTPDLITDIDPVQLNAVFDFKKELGKKGVLYFDYSDMDKFKKFLRSHLTQQLQTYMKTETETETETEIGFIDLIENAENNFALTENSILLIGNEIQSLGNKVEQRSKNLENQDITYIKKVLNVISDDMNQFADTIEPEIAIFSRSYSEGINSVITLSALLAEFNPDNQKELINVSRMLLELESNIKYSIDGLMSLKDAIESAPPFSVKFNRSKNRALDIIKKILTEFKNAAVMTTEANKIVESIAIDMNSAPEHENLPIPEKYDFCGCEFNIINGWSKHEVDSDSKKLILKYGDDILLGLQQIKNQEELDLSYNKAIAPSKKYEIGSKEDIINGLLVKTVSIKDCRNNDTLKDYFFNKNDKFYHIGVIDHTPQKQNSELINNTVV